jgi:tape measure domain-containing protein
MSQTVDNKVVEMRFDNDQFEKGVATSMSTIDKLKAKLNFQDADKSLSSLSDSAKKVDMSTLANSVQKVSLQFSSLQVIAGTALANITNNAVNTGRKILSALTVNPVKDGMSEYETQMNAVQTILANTQKEGTNVKIVNKYLDELNTYADKTIYNFTEMTRNIGTFTAAGVKLDTSVSSIKGIANLAAVSGSSAQQASTAMYQLSQAIAAGKVQLMDWNSVVNAGMGGQVFQDALIRTSEHLKTGAKEAINTYGSFRESLTKGEWLTTQVLTETLDQFATAADTQEEYEAAVKKFVDEGYSQEEAEQIATMAKTAGKAATKVKTFSQLIDTCKEALGSGWTTTWRLIFGDFEDARKLWTSVSDAIGGFINKFSDARNKVLDSTLYNNFKSLGERIKSVGEATETVTKATENFGEVVNQVIGGEFGNGAERVQKLTEAGMDWAHIQNLVNEQLGDSTRHATDYKEAQEEVTKAQAEAIESFAAMSDEQLTNIGFTQDEIYALRDLEAQSKKTGKSMQELLEEESSRKGGRELLIESFTNIGKAIGTVFKSVGEAWKSVFDPVTSSDLYGVIEKFHSMSESMLGVGEHADQLVSTFRGLFVILKWGTNILGGGFKIAIKVVSLLLKAFGLSFLDVTAIIGDFLYKIDQFLSENDFLAAGVNLLAEGIKMVASGLKELYDYISSLPEVQSFLEKIKSVDLSDVAQGWIESLSSGVKELKNLDLKEIGAFIIEGLKDGMSGKIGSIIEAISEIANTIIDTIKDILDIHSPSKVMIAIGGFIVAGLIKGILDAFPDVKESLNQLTGGMVTWFENIDWNQIFAGIASAGLLNISTQLATAIKNFSVFATQIGGVAASISGVLNNISTSIQVATKSFKKIMKAKAFKTRAEGIKEIAESLLILAGAVYILGKMNGNELKRATKCIAVLGTVLAVMTIAISKFSESSASLDKNGLNIKGLKTCLIQMGIALLLMAETVKIMGKLNLAQAIQGFIMLIGLCILIVKLTDVIGKCVDSEQMANINKFGKMMTKLAIALLLTIAAVKLIGLLKPDELTKGRNFAIAFTAFAILLGIAARLGGPNVSKFGTMMIKLAIAIGLMVAVVKLIDCLSLKAAIKGGIFMTAFIAFIGCMAIVSMLTENAKDFGKMILSISASLLLLAITMQLVGKLSLAAIGKGTLFMAAFAGFVLAMVAISKYANGTEIVKIGGTLLALSVSVAILAAVSIMLGMISLPALAKGIVAMGFLATFMSGMITATEGAEDCKGSIIAMAVAIGVMAAAVAALSFIEWQKLLPATLALSAVMAMFAIVEYGASNVKGAMGSIIAMSVAVGLLGIMLIALSQCKWQNTLAAAAGLSIVMLVFAGTLAIVGATAQVAIAAIPGIAVMTLALAAITVMIYELAQCKPESVLASAASLSVLLLALSVALAIVSHIPISGAIEGALGLSAFIGIMGLVLAALGGLSRIPGLTELVEDGGSFLSSIGYALGNFVGSIVGGFAAGVTSGLPEIADNLSAFGDKIQPFITSLSAVDPIDFVAKVGALTAGILLLTAADFVSSIMTFSPICKSFADLGSELSQFMINAMPFLTAALLISPDMMEGVKALAETIMIITAADLLSSISSWISGDNSMDKFGTQLVSFGNAIAEFSSTVAGKVDASAVEAAANAGKIMADMASTIPNSGGVLGFFAGENDIDTFGTMLKSFGKSIVSFSETVAGNIDQDAVQAAADAGSIMAKFQETIPNTGGVVDFFTGKNDMATFGSNLESFGKSIASFSEKVSGKIDSDAVQTAANAGAMMVELNKIVPDEGGVKGWWFGDNDLSDFGDNIADFGEAIASFSASVSGTVSATAISSAIDSAKDLVDFNTYAKDAKFDNLSNLNLAISTDFTGIAGSLQSVSSTISEGISIKNINSMISCCRSLVSFSAEIGKDSGSNLKSFASALSDFSKQMSNVDTSGLSSFSKQMKTIGDSGVNALLTSFKGASAKATQAGSSVAKAVSSGFSKNASSFTKAATGVLNKMIQTIKGYSSKASSAMKAVTAGMADGIISGKSMIVNNVKNAVKAGVTEARSYRDAFYGAGAYLVRGLANGISDNDYIVKAKAKAMAKAATKAAQKELDEHSPSKVFYKIGKYIPMGMVKGIVAYASQAKDSSKSMARSAVDGALYALTALTDMINGDIDMSPTIRPVVDMSSINASARDMNQLLGGNINLGLSAQLNAINSRMRSRNQNSGNADVISAITGLRKEISGISKPTYQIDGITYDDNSSISSAIETLVDAVITERRI